MEVLTCLEYNFSSKQGIFCTKLMYIPIFSARLKFNYIKNYPFSEIDPKRHDESLKFVLLLEV